MRAGQPAAVLPENPQQPKSADQIVAAAAHRLVSIERMRLIGHAEKLRPKSAVEADRLLERVTALRVALDFFRRLQRTPADATKKAKPGHGAKARSESRASE
jgi:hypothetical protein